MSNRDAWSSHLDLASGARDNSDSDADDPEDYVPSMERATTPIKFTTCQACKYEMYYDPLYQNGEGHWMHLSWSGDACWNWQPGEIEEIPLAKATDKLPPSFVQRMLSK